jgi:hypothetical protein
MIAYQVNGQFINNLYLALHTSWKIGKPVGLYCYDHEFDQFDWSVEPEASLDSLMADHARVLRNRYERLVLLWSGGTDSHTIYNIFKNNGIHIDEIIVKADKDSIAYPEASVEWLVKNHWDATTKITKYDEFDSNARILDLGDENWIWRDQGELFKYGQTPVGNYVRFLCEKNHSGHKWKAIGGYEKPRLVYRDGNWYHRQLNYPLQPTMGNDYIEHFFLEPLIAIKQSHLVKRAVKRLIEDNNLSLYNDDWAEAKWPKTAEGYRAWSTACGRHDELIIGTSHYQKMANDIIIKTEINTVGDWRDLSFAGDVRLKHDLSDKNKAAEVYIKGFLNLNHETGFVDWLRDNNWFRTSDKSFTNLNFIWSKEYNIGQ